MQGYNGMPVPATGTLAFLFTNASATQSFSVTEQSIVDLSDIVQGDFVPTPSFFGSALAGIGDLDGDGVPDMVATCYLCANANTTAFPDDKEMFFVFFLNANGTVKSYVRHTYAEIDPEFYTQADDQFGTSVANIGDIDGDGVVDVAVGARYGNTSYAYAEAAGAVYILLLNTTGGIKDVVRIEGEQITPELELFDQFGWDVTAVGDIDGNGVVDLAVGAVRDEPGNSTLTSTGTVYLLFMGPNVTLLNATFLNHTIIGEDLQNSAFLGETVEGVGDVDGDGTPDLAVTAQFADSVANSTLYESTGVVYLVCLTPNGTEKVFLRLGNQTQFRNVTTGDNFGSDMVLAGDLNGDGVQDLLVGSVMDGLFATGPPGSDTDTGVLHVVYLNRTAEQCAAGPGLPRDDTLRPGDYVAIGIVGGVAFLILVVLAGIGAGYTQVQQVFTEEQQSSNAGIARASSSFQEHFIHANRSHAKHFDVRHRVQLTPEKKQHLINTWDVGDAK
jgi:hypothetical protein